MAYFSLSGKRLTLSGDPSACVYSVTIAGQTWNMTDRPWVRFSDGTTLPFPQPESEGTEKSGTAESIYAIYSDFGDHRITVRTSASLEVLTEDVRFTLQVTGDTPQEIEKISFPAPFEFGADYGDSGENTAANLPRSYTILPRMQGTLVPAGKPIEIFSGIVFERDSYMPMFGQVRENTGYLAIYDTPYDVRYELRGEQVAPLWVPTLGLMGYPRTLLLKFQADCDYNDLAQAYRRYVKQKGQLVTLREKIIRNPRVEKLLGCPIIYAGIATHISPDSDYYKPEDPENNDRYTSFYTQAEQIRALAARGVPKAYTHFDGWGKHGYDNLHPDPFPPHEAAGGVEGMRELAKATTEANFIFGIHDQYRDYYYDAPSFTFENAVTYADGTHPFCSIWYGGKHSFLCSSVARDYVRRNYAMFEELGINVEAAYLDVFSVVQLDECYHPAHPATREQCAAFRRECLDILTDRGIIPSSEEVLDCILPSQVLCHHAPYFTKDLGSNDSTSVGIPIPLLNLVYHDCVVIPWIGGKHSRGGWGIPVSDSGYAHAWLNGNPLCLSVTADEAQIAENAAVCANAEKVALSPIVKHEFLSADYRIQRTTFENGVTVTVNFDTDEVTVV